MRNAAFHWTFSILKVIWVYAQFSVCLWPLCVCLLDLVEVSQMFTSISTTFITTLAKRDTFYKIVWLFFGLCTHEQDWTLGKELFSLEHQSNPNYEVFEEFLLFYFHFKQNGILLSWSQPFLSNASWLKGILNLFKQTVGLLLIRVAPHKSLHVQTDFYSHILRHFFYVGDASSNTLKAQWRVKSLDDSSCIRNATFWVSTEIEIVLMGKFSNHWIKMRYN